MLSSQSSIVPPEHVPFRHVVFWWHLSITHGVLSAAMGGEHSWVAVSQAVFVQGLSSSWHILPVPTHLPAAHVSLAVQSLPSLQAPPLMAACWQPSVESHVSLVQPSLSSQLAGDPPTQVPFEHLSTVVHASPSEHVALSSVVFTQP